MGSVTRGFVNPTIADPARPLFAINVNTTDFDPGQYIVNLDFTCSGTNATEWLNVTPYDKVTFR